MTDAVNDHRPMSSRDVEQWLLGAADALDALGVRAVLGRGPDLGGDGPSSWISFASDLGSGRLVRRHDGACHSDAHRRVDGAVLIDRSNAVTTSVELAAVVSAITPLPRRGDGRES